MLDLAFIRSNPDAVKEAARLKNNNIDIDYLLEVDRQVTTLQRQVEEARARQNQVSKLIPKVGKDKEQREALIAEGKHLAEQIKSMEPQLNALLEERQQLLYLVPNIPDPAAPVGKDENDNVPIKYWGTIPTFDFEPHDHYALMQELDMVDIERGVKIAGARSYILKNDAARLELALMNFALDRMAPVKSRLQACTRMKSSNSRICPCASWLFAPVSGARLVPMARIHAASFASINLTR